MPHSRSRRALLSALCTVALAGCATQSESTPESEKATSETPTDTATQSTRSTPAETPEAPRSIEGEWRLPRHDPGKSNYAPESGGPTEAVAELWSIETDTKLSGPVVAGETVYLGTVRAVDVKTGTQRWQHQMEETAETPRAVGDSLYVPTDDGIVALDPGDGTEQWSVETDQRGDLVVADHGLYYVENDPTVEDINETPPVVALESSGQERWRTQIERPWEDRIFAGPEMVFVSTGGVSGQPWQFGVGGGSLLNDQPENGADFPAERFYNTGMIVSIEGFFGSLEADAVSTDEDGWSAGLGEGGSYSVSGSSDAVYVVHRRYEEDVRLLARSGSDDGPHWSVTGLSNYTQPPVVTRETVLVGTTEKLRCFDPEDGTERWSISGDWKLNRFAVVDDIVVAIGGSTVRALRPA